jgi:hypothetical protein
VADQVVARLQQISDLHRLVLEVDSLDRIVRRITGPIDDREPVQDREPAQRAERHRSVRDASVEQHDPRPGAHDLDVH